MGVEIRISVAGGDVADMESLYDWLRGESELAGRVKLASPGPQAGQLGTVSDALVVAVGSGGTISVLATALKGWLSLPRRSDVRIRIKHADGSCVEIDAERVDTGQADVESIIRQALDHSPPGSRGGAS
jgi:hypothetical protein